MTVYALNMPEVATYWPPGSPDGYGGFSASDAEDLKCRWQIAAKQYRDASGEIALSEAVIYVDRMVEVGGFLARGEAADRTEAREIRAVMVSPSLDGQIELVKAMLGKAD